MSRFKNSYSLVNVENRFKENHQFTSTAIWRYCDSANNPVEFITKQGSKINVLQEKSIWWHEPTYLFKSKGQWQGNYDITPEYCHIES